MCDEVGCDKGEDYRHRQVELRFKPGDLVKCIRGHRGAGLIAMAVYEVAVSVQSAEDHTGNKEVSGVILYPDEKTRRIFPYIWDENRFVLVRSGK